MCFFCVKAVKSQWEEAFGTSCRPRRKTIQAVIQLNSSQLFGFSLAVSIYFCLFCIAEDEKPRFMDIREFFYFQRSDRNVIIVLTILVIVACIVFGIIGHTQQATTNVNADNKHTLTDSAVAGTTAAASPKTEHRLFPFDPNTADSTDFLELGLQPWQVRNIYRFREKGGVYREPRDFARLYGLTVDQFKALEPYIRIAPGFRPASTLFADEGYADRYPRTTRPLSASSGSATTRLSDTETDRPYPVRDTLLYPRKLRMGEQIALTTTDTTTLKRVPGVGSGFARAIVAYGKRLGGYHSVLQLLEIRNFPESALDYFTPPQTPNLRKLNLNKMSVEQMRAHPYLNFHRAKAIADYRRLHGPLQSLQDLRLLKDFPADVIEKLEPYVEF